MLKLIKELCQISGVSGFEEEIRCAILQRIRPYASSIRIDAVGNLIVFKKGLKATGKTLLLTAHMDEVGFIVKKIDDAGYIKFAAVGGIDRRIVLGKKVFVGEKRIPGVIGLRAYHLVSASEEKIVPKIEEMYIDIGAKDKAWAQEMVSLGDFIVFDSDCIEFGNGLLKAKAIDDRLGCAIMIRLLEKELPMDCTFVFSAQEEVGTRGAFGAAFSVSPDIALVLEGTTAADLSGIKDHKQVTVLGEGPVLGLMDNATLYDRELFALLRTLAKENHIPWQTKRYIAGGNDASAIQRSANGVRVASLSAPIRYLHTPSSVASIKDFDFMLLLSQTFIEAIASKWEEK
ncbi:MAG: M42 family peptidase [Clostridia bacterium]|nr:M42 family peptidase [Clostridia bacterium]